MTLKKKLVTAGILLASTFSVSTAFASSSTVQNVIDESYVQPDYVLGYSLSPEQQSQTLSLLHYNEGKDKQVKTLNTSAYAKIMNVADDPSIQLYSSVKIEKLGAKEVLKVNIVTPNNITKVTQDMYRNATVTLGIEHANITIAAPIAVTGESALAGIYYSLEQKGANVPAENKALAQQELNALSGINAENAGKEGYDANKLNVALTDIKKQVAEGGSNLSKTEVEDIVKKTLENYGLDKVISGDQINVIVNFAINLSNSGVISNGHFQETLKNLKDSIVAKSGASFKDINLNFDTAKAVETGKGIWQQIVDFFRSLIG
ncbi:DUF1002 domain-containing protein [Streptococcus iniae]|uniref:DUF1002 domain-containing protein n=1 Tax=Streptococcus iniae TaxID=1346 RepID=UPI002B322AF2|nr:DUF1002 domain-containing protein [Streptococcus iniae]WNZ90694.1 DUF1002 domain-containing protein [Streptococcus iniae]WNZ92321.1 DUF1002 domain-containing protein [Streptococcus iniae]WNZ97931.1 DUF1002 domain-containing protein [Streptococcus iniae]